MSIIIYRVGHFNFSTLKKEAFSQKTQEKKVV